MATELGKAYVQIVPSAQGISGSITKAMGGEVDAAGTKAGQSFGRKFISVAGKAIAAAGLGKLIAESVNQGGQLEQSLGGIETLFKDSSDKVVKYANEAYKTSGLSANDYMQNVTSFSASLLQSLGGDTDKAADIANMAMIDMSDNANKMGTAMQDIQNAYQGFAKQNYTMLDNLKLGYGGTKKEMERLLADAQELSGVEYDIDNLSDVYEAIHVIQEEIGITGTTALEASETIEGSLKSVKSAFRNVLGQIAIGGDVTAPLQALGETLVTFIRDNLFPMLTNVISSLPGVIVDLFVTAGPSLLDAGLKMITNIVTGLGQGLPVMMEKIASLIPQIVTTLINNIPGLVQAGISLIQGLAQGFIQAIPTIVASIPTIIQSIVTAISTATPMIIESGVSLLTSMVQNLPQIIDTIVTAIPKIVNALVDAIVSNVDLIIDAGVTLLTALIENLPTIITTVVTAIPKIVISLVTAIGERLPDIAEAGFKLFTSLITKIPEAIVEIVKSIPSIISAIVSALAEGIPSIVEVGKNMIQGLWEGIKSLGGWLKEKVSGFFSGIWGGIKDFFGIQSPSTLFAWAGEMNMLGFAYGMEDNLNVVSDAMDKVEQEANRTLSSELDFTVAGNFAGINGAMGSGFNNGSLDVQNEETNELLHNLLTTLNEKQFGGDVVLDSGELVGALTTPLDESLTMKKQHEQFGGGSLVPVF